MRVIPYLVVEGIYPHIHRLYEYDDSIYLL